MAADSPIPKLIARIEKWSGLDLRQRESELVRWLAMRSATQESPEAHARRLTQPDSAEAAELIRSFTVPHTRFFRDPEQLKAAEAALAALPGPLLRICVAGCSTGEEAYTLALLAVHLGREVEIVGLDINSHSLAKARVGRYPREALSTIPAQYHKDFLLRGEFIELGPRVQRCVRFVEHNLLLPPPLPTGSVGWHLILCRNVLIYFRTEQAAATLQRLADAVVPGGYLMLGASEFHHRTAALQPTRLAQRIVLQRPAVPPAPVGARAPIAPPPPPSRPPNRRASDVAIRVPGRLAGRLLSGQLDAVLGEVMPDLMRDPEQQPALLLAGIAYHLKGRHHEAAALLEKTLAQDGTCWPATYFLALSLEGLGKVAAARGAYHTLGQNATPTPAAQWLITLLELQQWQSEAVALARHRLSRTQEPLPVFPLTAEDAPSPESQAVPQTHSPTQKEISHVRSTT